MKIGVLSDTHLSEKGKTGGWRSLLRGGPETLEELIKHLEEVFAGVEMVLHAGDISAKSVLDELEKLWRVEAVQGNMDRGVLPLPQKKVVEIGGHRIGLIHGWGSPDGIQRRIRGSFEDVHAIVYGHTHEPFNEVVDGVLFFNPGSPTDNFFAPYKSVGILEISQTITGRIIKL